MATRRSPESARSPRRLLEATPGTSGPSGTYPPAPQGCPRLQTHAELPRQPLTAAPGPEAHPESPSAPYGCSGPPNPLGAHSRPLRAAPSPRARVELPHQPLTAAPGPPGAPRRPLTDALAPRPARSPSHCSSPPGRPAGCETVLRLGAHQTPTRWRFLPGSGRRGYAGSAAARRRGHAAPARLPARGPRGKAAEAAKTPRPAKRPLGRDRTRRRRSGSGDH